MNRRQLWRKIKRDYGPYLPLSPYLLVTLFPAFPNQRPFVDVSSGAAETSPQSYRAYLAILTYHAGELLSAPSAMAVTMCTVRKAIAVNVMVRCNRSRAARGSPANATRLEVAMPSTMTAVKSTRDTAPVARLTYQRTWVIIQDTSVGQPASVLTEPC